MNTQSGKDAAKINSEAQFHSSNDNLYKPAILLLSDDGMILNVNKEGERLFDYSNTHLNNQHISRIIPKLAEVDLLEGNGCVNPYLRFLSRIGHSFELISIEGRQFSGELFFNDVNASDQHQIIIMIYPTHHEKNMS